MFSEKKNLITNSKYNRPSIKNVPKESNNILCKVKLHVETLTWIATIPCWEFLPSDYIEHKQKHQYASREKCVTKTKYLARDILTFWKVMYNHNWTTNAFSYFCCSLNHLRIVWPTKKEKRVSQSVNRHKFWCK